MSTAAPPNSTSPAASLRHRTTRGVVWVFAETAASKVVSVTSQILLAWLLVPADFGLIGLAYSVTAFTGLLTEPGLSVILVQRQHEFDRLVTPSFWLAVGLGVIGSAIMVVSAPLAAYFYHEPRLVGILLIMAIAPPIGNLALVSFAKVNIDMRFKTLSIVNTTMTFLTLVFTIVLAVMGFGVYSLAIPIPVIATIRMLVFIRLAPCRVRFHPQFHIMRTLWRDATTLFGTRALWAVTAQGDYIVLGYFYDAKVVGIYYFAFNLSTQVIQLFQTNLTRVLFPALSAIQDDTPRLMRAFQRAISLMGVLAVPFAFLQAAVSDPMIHLLFQSKWWPAIVPLQILCVGMGIRVVGSLSGAMNQARGWYHVQLITAIIYTSIFAVSVIAASYMGQAVAVAIAVSLVGVAWLPIGIYVAGYPHISWSEVARVTLPPILIAAVTIGAGFLLSLLIQPGTLSWFDYPVALHVSRAAVVIVVGIPAYWLATRRWLPAEYQETVRLLRSLVKRG